MAWLFDYFTNFLRYFGFYQKSGRLVLLGLDHAGKTTLLQMLKEASEVLTLGGIRLTTYDLGGHVQARRVWKKYLPAVDAVVFVVDAATLDRIQEARTELQALLSEDMIADIPFVILSNKIDKPDAFSEEQMKIALGVQNLCSGKGQIPLQQLGKRPLEIFACSILYRQGYGDALRWLSQYLGD